MQSCHVFQVCLQIPDNLIEYTEIIGIYLQKYSDASIYTVSSSAPDSCCGDQLSADHIQADACIHFGHTCLSFTKGIPTLYIFLKQYLDTSKFCKKFLNYFKNKSEKMLLFYDVAFAHAVGKFKSNYFMLTTKMSTNVHFSPSTLSLHNSILVYIGGMVLNVDLYGFYLYPHGFYVKPCRIHVDHMDITLTWILYFLLWCICFFCT